MNALHTAFNLGSLQECREDPVGVWTCPTLAGESRPGKVATFGSRFRVLKEEDDENPGLTDSEDEDILEKAEVGEDSEDEGFESEIEDFAQELREWIEVAGRKAKQEGAVKGRSLTGLDPSGSGTQLSSVARSASRQPEH